MNSISVNFLRKLQSAIPLLLLCNILLFSCSNDDKKPFPGSDDDNLIEEEDNTGDDLEVLSDENEIIAFTFRKSDNPEFSQNIQGVIHINGSIEGAIQVGVPYGTQLNQLTPVLTLSDHATVSPNSLEPQDFTTPVVYTVTAEDGSTKVYTIQVIPDKNSERELLSFVFGVEENPQLSEDVVGVIDQENYTVTVTFPRVISNISLRPTITVSDGASVAPESIAAENFISDREYVVRAENGITQLYNIHIIRPEPITDRESLILFAEANYNTYYFDTVLPWNFTDETMNSWKGLTHENGNVTRLELKDSNIVNFAPELGNLTSLEYLDLSDNTIVDVPPAIGLLENLETLHLDNTSLESLPSEIGNLGKLTKLSLTNNALVSLPASIGDLIELEELFLEYNTLESLPASIGDLVELKELSLQFNALESLPSEIGNLGKLTVLELNGNSISTLPLTIGNLINLEICYLYYNSLNTLPSEMGNLTKLKILTLWFNPLTTVPQAICNLETNYGTQVLLGPEVQCVD